MERQLEQSRLTTLNIITDLKTDTEGHYTPPYFTMENKTMNSIEILKSIALSSKSNHKGFTDTTRLEKIKEYYKEMGYICTKSPLFWAFSKESIKDTPNPVIITSHADTVMDKQFCEYDEKTGILKGTFDNLICNAANICLANKLSHMGIAPDRSKYVIHVFTAEEESGGAGIRSFMAYLNQVNIKPSAVICLDVTPDGFKDDLIFSLENYQSLGKGCPFNIITTAIERLGSVNNVGNYIPRGLPDEALMFNMNVPKCSYCIPILENHKVSPKDNQIWNCSHMHSKEGVIVKAPLYYAYIQSLFCFTNNLISPYTMDHSMELLALRDEAKKIEVPKYYAVQSFQWKNSKPQKNKPVEISEDGLPWYRPEPDMNKPKGTSIASLKALALESKNSQEFIETAYDTYTEWIEKRCEKTGLIPIDFLVNLYDEAHENFKNDGKQLSLEDFPDFEI